MLRRAYPDTAVVDRATAVFEEIIAAERATGGGGADHFAAAGANDRIWNALEKLAVRAPEVFVEYYANPVIALVSHTWLGPGYQVTSQPNVVRPGGKAQVGHRDYHLGFQPSAVIEQFPPHVHRLSPMLTLQGAVAHSDMPVETGPTLYLPHSQKYLPGYLAMNRPDFQQLFFERHVQLPLATGDAAFFNPAVCTGPAPTGPVDRRRIANLLQVSSAFGRAMESVDRECVSAAIYPALAAAPFDVEPAIAAAAEGYAFPTNIDRDPPVDGLAPPTPGRPGPARARRGLVGDHGPRAPRRAHRTQEDDGMSLLAASGRAGQRRHPGRRCGRRPRRRPRGRAGGVTGRRPELGEKFASRRRRGALRAGRRGRRRIGHRRRSRRRSSPSSAGSTRWSTRPG